MARGLFWLTLLFVFFGLAWAGWNEFQKIEAYKSWAEKFDNAKYDIYAVLALKGQEITWGKPTRKSPVEIQTFSLQDVEKINLLVDDQVIEITAEERNGKAAIEFVFANDIPTVKVPFTEVDLARKWTKYLRENQAET